MIEEALEYSLLGWPVLPLHSVDGGACTCKRPDCSSPGKHPLTLHGLADASLEQRTLERWWSMWPFANLGVATGSVSGLVVVDCDGEDGLASLDSLSLPPTATVETGSGGTHLYYKYPDVVVRNSAKRIAPGIDIRGDGGYVVAPPSKHVKGLYAWLDQGTPAPYPVLRLSGASQSVLECQPVGQNGSLVIPAGRRNQTLLGEGGHLRARGYSQDELLAALHQINKTRCDPQLPSQEIERIASNLARHDQALPLGPNNQARTPHIRVVSGKELFMEPDIPHREILGPLLVREQRLMLGAHTGEGKTTMAMQMVKSVTDKERFLKWKGSGGKVLIVDAEQGLRTIKRRLEEARLQDSEEVDILRAPDGMCLNDPAEANLFEEVLDAGRYDLVVLDPLYKLHKEDLSDERAAVELMGLLDRWRTTYGFALLLLAHCRKPTYGAKFTIHDITGSAAITRGAEVVLGLQRIQSGEARLHFWKDRDGDLPIAEEWKMLFDRNGVGFLSPMEVTWDK